MERGAGQTPKLVLHEEIERLPSIVSASSVGVSKALKYWLNDLLSCKQTHTMKSHKTFFLLLSALVYSYAFKFNFILFLKVPIGVLGESWETCFHFIS